MQELRQSHTGCPFSEIFPKPTHTTDVPFLRKSSFFFVPNRSEFNDPGALSTTGLGTGPSGRSSRIRAQSKKNAKKIHDSPIHRSRRLLAVHRWGHSPRT